MKNINLTVADVINQNPGGGKQFFGNLDEAIMEEDYIIQLLTKLGQEFGGYPYIVLQGAFGRFVLRTVSLRTEQIILAPSGLRDGMLMDDLEYHKDTLDGRRFIFIDGSIYSGRTKKAIEEELTKYGASIMKTYVVYDGSPTPQTEDVESLFRYHPARGYTPPSPIKVEVE